jgi:uncharacterized protein YukE
MADFKFGPAEDFSALADRMQKQAEILTPVYVRLQNAIKAVQGGAWTGEGAGAFVTGATDLLVRIRQLGEGFDRFHNRLEKAGEIAVENMDHIDQVIDQ